MADIVATAGLSQRSFFRRFGSKEDVVFGDRVPTAEEVLEELLTHLAGSPARDAPRARCLGKHPAWTGALVPEIAARNGPGGPDAGLKAQTMVNTAPSRFDVAVTRRADGEADRSLVSLVNDVFGFVRIPRA
ncbi:TetR/AcrR family transcriptional regulator [Streptomyces cinereoruber]|uniref:TetR/AcrR family transcriptional regulator n=1 Tax=Streptomyces cinereoruber TaxID=67260 RepID=UPI003EBB24C6